jgi:hypothetical protein
VHKRPPVPALEIKKVNADEEEGETKIVGLEKLISKAKAKETRRRKTRID